MSRSANRTNRAVTEPTLTDVMTAINGLSERVSALEAKRARKAPKAEATATTRTRRTTGKAAPAPTGTAAPTGDRKPGQPYQDARGRWHSPNGGFCKAPTGKRAGKAAPKAEPTATKPTLTAAEREAKTAEWRERKAQAQVWNHEFVALLAAAPADVQKAVREQWAALVTEARKAGKTPAKALKAARKAVKAA